MVARKADGTVWVTGANAHGQLGLGDTTQRSTWVQVTSLAPFNIKQVAGTGAYNGSESAPYNGGNTYAVSTAGNLYVTGSNGRGELGLGDTVKKQSFQEVTTAGIQGKVQKVVITGSFNDGSTGQAYVITTDGQLWAAGYNGNGELGTGDTTQRTTFTRIFVPGGARVMDVHGVGKADAKGIIVTLDNGAMMTTGSNAFGQMGSDTLNQTEVHSLKYVIGFEPGSKQNAVASNSLIPFNVLSGAELGNILDNLNFAQTWNWSTASTTSGLFKIAANALTTGSLFTAESTSNEFSGELAQINVAGNSASTTGTGLRINVSGNLSSSTALKITNAGAGLAMDIQGLVAFRNNGAAYSTTGASHNVNFGNTSLVRMTGSADQIISGIANGTDGAMLTIMNVSAASTTIQNQNGSSIAANRIITGVGSDLVIGPDKTVSLIYDSANSRWRVVNGGGSGTGGTTIVQQLATSTVSIIPKLMDASAGTGQVGNTIIYRNQIYTMGAGFAGLALTGGPAAYGVNGDTTSNSGGSNAYSPTLVPVQNPPSGWSSVVGNYSSVCALSNVGTVYCWGHNSQGQLGDGTNSNNFIARKVTINGNARPITAIYTSSNYGLNTSVNSFWAIDDLGQVWAWGDNTWGQLGNGNTIDQLLPVRSGSAALSGIFIRKLSISSSEGTHVAAVSDTGALYTWGSNGTNGSNGGQLGLGTSGAPVSTPSAVPGMTTGVVDVVARGQSSTLAFTVVLKSDGTVWTAGSNNTGQAGIGTEDTNLLSFTQSNSLGANFITKIYAMDTSGGGQVAVVNSANKVFFTGYNGYGNLGNNTTTQLNSYSEPTDTGFQNKVARVVMGGSGPGNQIYNYILTTDGQIYSAGDNAWGQLGQGGTTDSITFQKILGPGDGSRFIDIRAFGYDEESGGIAVLDNGSIMSWGNNIAGAAGNDINSKQVAGATGIVYEYSGTTVENGLNDFSGVPRYVIGFEPGSKQNLYSGALTLMSTLAGATSGNAIDNANWTQNWMWGTASDTNALVMSANNLTSGTLQSLSTDNTLFAGSLLKVTASGNATTSTGTLVDLVQTGASSSATGLKITTADKNGLEPFNILTPCGDKASLIFNELPDVSAEESNVNSDVATKQIVKLEKAYNIPAAEWTSNGLIELEVLIPKSMTKNEYILNFIALDDLIYDNKVVVPRGAKIRYFSKLYEVKEYDKESNVVEAALDIRPTNTFGSDYVADKMSNFSITAVAYTKNL
jgi:alpha-tubulin suppressor-like RCC1 family protein